MQMQDTLRRVHGGPVVAVLAEAFEVAPAKADAALRTAVREMAWHLERNTLSRAGLAELVNALGHGQQALHLDHADGVRSESVRADGDAILSLVLGTADRRRALASRVAREAGLSTSAVASMLPALAVVAMARVAAGATKGLGEIVAVMPSLGRWSRGSPYADLADILRRACGAGPYAPAKLRRVVRRSLAHAAGFPPRGPLRWYLQFMLVRPVSRPIRTMLSRAFRNGSMA